MPVFAAVMRDYADPYAIDTVAGPFDSGESVGVRVLGIVESQAPIARRFEPGNPLADKDGYVYTSNVNTIEALTDMISASRTFQSNVEVINTSRDLLLKTIAMGR
jgi:flagellar basal-body rod protein FlgC